MALTKLEAAGLLGITVSTLERLRRTDPKFPARKVGGEIRIIRDDLVAWMRSLPHWGKQGRRPGPAGRKTAEEQPAASASADTKA